MSEIDDIFAAAKKQIKSSSKCKTVQKTKQRREKKSLQEDSRGTGTRRKTVEGYNIYNEDELGIATAGGDTPQCPFDCQCCF